MICIISGNYDEAKTWASGQNLDDKEWFYPVDEHDLQSQSNFHVIVVGTAGHNIPLSWFNRFYDLAQKRGAHGRNDSR
jgi:hypothetical protein